MKPLGLSASGNFAVIFRRAGIAVVDVRGDDLGRDDVVVVTVTSSRRRTTWSVAQLRTYRVCPQQSWGANADAGRRRYCMSTEVLPARCGAMR
jgi:hypothetical protein